MKCDGVKFVYNININNYELATSFGCTPEPDSDSVKIVCAHDIKKYTKITDFLKLIFKNTVANISHELLILSY